MWHKIRDKKLIEINNLHYNINITFFDFTSSLEIRKAQKPHESYVSVRYMLTRHTTKIFGIDKMLSVAE
jgi:adenylyl- and sulfurtransferase ThiI